MHLAASHLDSGSPRVHRNECQAQLSVEVKVAEAGILEYTEDFVSNGGKRLHWNIPSFCEAEIRHSGSLFASTGRLSHANAQNNIVSKLHFHSWLGYH